MKLLAFLTLIFLLMLSCGNEENKTDDDVISGQDESSIVEDEDNEAPDKSVDEEPDQAIDYSDMDIPEESKYILENGHDVNSLDDLDDFSDLMYLKEILKDKKIVMLGDNHHGAAETKKYFTRMITFLYKELGFNAVVWEMGVASGKIVDDYIQTGDTIAFGNLDDLDYKQLSSTHDYINVFFNLQSINHERIEGTPPLHFYGIDTASIHRNSREFLRKYLESCNKSEIIDTFETDYLEIIDAVRAKEVNFFEVCNDLIDIVEKFITVLDENKDALITESSEEEFNEKYDIAIDILRNHESSCEGNNQIREDRIFENFSKVASNHDKIIIAYGQTHVLKQNYEYRGKRMKTLSQKIHDNYDSDRIYSIGSGFSIGKVSWHSTDDEGNSDLYDYDLPTIGDKYFEYYFHETGKDLFFLDWNNVNKDDLDFWLNQEYSSINSYQFTPAWTLDAFFYIDEVTPLTCCVSREDLKE